ncbi:hypothetical protein IscW_ISCW022467, partial [Ixodes scapularis]
NGHVATVYAQMDAHIWLHAPLYQVAACPTTFVRFQIKSRLIGHKLSHSNKRPFKCPSCPKAFQTKNDVHTHIKR